MSSNAAVPVVAKGEQDAEETSIPRQKKGWWRARKESTGNHGSGSTSSNEGKVESSDNPAAVEYKGTTAPPPKSPRRRSSKVTGSATLSTTKKRIKPKATSSRSLSKDDTTESLTQQKKDWWLARKVSSNGNTGNASRVNVGALEQNDSSAPPKSPCKAPRRQSQPVISTFLLAKETPASSPRRSSMRRTKSSNPVNRMLIPATAAIKEEDSSETKIATPSKSPIDKKNTVPVKFPRRMSLPHVPLCSGENGQTFRTLEVASKNEPAMPPLKSPCGKKKVAGVAPPPPIRNIPTKKTGLDKAHQDKLPKNASRRTGRSKQQAIRKRQGKDEIFANLPVFTHSDAKEDFILQALYNKDIFSTVTTGQMKQLVAAFDKTRYEAGDIIVNEGDTTDDYFYVVDQGIAEVTLKEDHICTCEKGDSFGELSLLYASSHPFTVLALDHTEVFRIDGNSFRIILATECKRSQQKKLRLLQGIDFLEHMPAHAVKLLAEAMTPREFRSGEMVLKKGQDATAFFVVSEGKLQCKDGTSKPWKTGNYFGDSDLATGEKVTASVVATTQSMVFSIGKETFEKALGSMSRVILKDQDVCRLSEIPFVKGAVASREQMAALADLLRERSYAANERIPVLQTYLKVLFCTAHCSCR